MIVGPLPPLPEILTSFHYRGWAQGQLHPLAAWTLAEGVSRTRGEATFLSGPLPADEGLTWVLGSLAVLGGGWERGELLFLPC